MLSSTFCSAKVDCEYIRLNQVDKVGRNIRAESEDGKQKGGGQPSQMRRTDFETFPGLERETRPLVPCTYLIYLKYIQIDWTVVWKQCKKKKKTRQYTKCDWICDRSA